MKADAKNRLAGESSPYLRQHAENPVDWYPWGEEALARARAEDKPILLSIGYSACHWCHVMAHESFENSETARLMNERFVNIKVDREERPDLDRIYQNVALALTRGGGWPLTVFLTPELTPFFGGTYFPPEDRYGRPGFPRVLEAIGDAYRERREDVRENASQLTEFIREQEGFTAEVDGAEDPASLPELRDAAEKILSAVDLERGGIGRAPKFPNPMLFTYLWRAGASLGVSGARAAVVLTLRRMADGGIYDQIGGGFSRYSVDDAWSVPHFEKMLYDNALLLKLYAEVLLTDGRPAGAVATALSANDRARFLDVIEQTVGYLVREMRAPSGAFFAAQDADSEGEEGKYFVWDRAELDAVLPEELSEIFALHYGVASPGNFEGGKTVLYRARTAREVGAALGISEASARERIEAARAAVFAAREQRVKPGLDDKVLTAWNGLLLSGLAWASRALSAAGRVEAADLAWSSAHGLWRFVRDRARAASPSDPDRLPSVFHGDAAKLKGYLDDYAFMAMGALDFSRLARDPAGEEASAARGDARRWAEAALRHFSDGNAAAYFFTSDDHETLVHRPKSVVDGATPAGTAVLLACLQGLRAMGEATESQSVELRRQLASMRTLMVNRSIGFGELLSVSLLERLGAIEVAGKGAATLLPHPHLFSGPTRTPSSGSGEIPGITLCHNQVCSLPYSSPEAAEAKMIGMVVARPIGDGNVSS